MENILIIKTGAAGDVVRTTSLLNVLNGNIYWVTAHESKPLLPADLPGLAVLSLQEAFQSLNNKKFSQVISLEEDDDCARLAIETNTSHLSGIYLDKGKITYTDDSANWFDMSRVSRLGTGRADELKKGNTLSYQHHIFKMIGEEFKGQPYRVFSDKSVKAKDGLIGIEKRTGKQWPDKQWHGYDKLCEKLQAGAQRVKIFEERKNIRNYLADIAKCSHIVSGDTMAMHIALAYQKTCTTIFNCTSPQEIYDYGLMKKMISPFLHKYFYATTFDKEVIESVSVDEVFNTIPFSH